MRTYTLYLIEDEFAFHYFGRERMFYQLFKEYKNSNGNLKAILEMQINYITKPIPTFCLQQLIHQKLNKNKDFYIEDGIYYIKKGSKSSWARLEFCDRFLKLDSKGSYDAETVFFEVLRKCESSFLAVDLDHHRYGWLNPIKERKFV
ncbi:sporulation inhibitor of replication protein SirA [Bacillus methanolicus]|uniref:sporulation inhibitor of replication protein SirA n=1 Tax=Bacillus methanolicus TaxID=1471 RepID=UPI0023801445|nr:sporulation inhibitor of replication protein SirA [Bacillus methanolicus]MDE3838621.1 sporulation inhibitor of replication protein SirA [Bacillus methanolicus]